MSYNVLFVCSANMCRSPMAQGYLKKRIEEEGFNGVRVRSAALYFQEGNPATSGARDVAIKYGFDLSEHRSRFMDDFLFDWADEILVMTTDHYKHIDSLYPGEASAKVRLLGSFDPEYNFTNPSSSSEIMDPYGNAQSTYDTVFNQIKRSIDSWVEARKHLFKKD